MRLRLSKFKLPRSLNVAADMYYSMRQRRYELQAAVEEQRVQESQLRAHLLESLPAGNAEVVGEIARVKLVPKIGVKITNWDDLHEYVRRYAAWGILQRKVDEDVIRKLWENGKEVPGVEPSAYNEVSAVKR